jgi:hypothetical protein
VAGPSRFNWLICLLFNENLNRSFIHKNCGTKPPAVLKYTPLHQNSFSTHQTGWKETTAVSARSYTYYQNTVLRISAESYITATGRLSAG